MTLQADDPRLTAYVLGELDADEREAFERELAASPEAERELDAIRRTVDLVRRELTAAPTATSAAGSNGHVAADAPTHTGTKLFDFDDDESRRGSRTFALVTAATILIAITAAVWLPTRHVALDDEGDALSVALAPNGEVAQWHFDAAASRTPTGHGALTLSASQPSLENATVSSVSANLLNGVPAEQAAAGEPVTAPGSATTTAGLPFQRGEAGDSYRYVPASPGADAENLTHRFKDGSSDPNYTIMKPVWTTKTYQRALNLDRNRNGYPVGDLVTPQRSSSIAGQAAASANEALNRQIPPLAGKGTIDNQLGQYDVDAVSNLNGSLDSDSDGLAVEGTTALARNERKLDESRLGVVAEGIVGGFIVGFDDAERGREQLAELERGHNTEAYDPIVENPFLGVMQNPLSTFSIDVDTASYSNVRRFLTSGALPPPGAVRIEEMVNYFRYDYDPPAEADGAPFAAHMEVAECPWRPAHRLVRIGLKGREIDAEDRPASNLVFLLDVSGSMDDPQKLPLVKEGLRMLVGQLRENDRVAIVVYAGASGLVLESTSGDKRDTILAAIDNLTPGGSTNGAAGIELAYDIASRHLIDGGTNRVILATDGDFNVGVTDQSQLVTLIEEEAKTGVFLTVLGFGMGNLKDSTLEMLADKGNGNYAYVDSDREARKVLVDQLSGTLVTIAKDVKIQLEFNPARVAAYRLIGYENRLLAKEDFNDDTKDAGEIGAGHTVTALYEVVPVEVLAAKTDDGAEDRAEGDGDGADNPEAADLEAAAEVDVREVDALEYLTVAHPSEKAVASPNLLTLKLRYKEPEGAKSKLLRFDVEDSQHRIGEATPDFQLAASVAAFGMLLRGSQFAGEANLDAVMEWAQPALSDDAEGYRREYVDLVRTAREIARRPQ